MKYVIYARKSSESEERQILSIESQILELKEFAAKEKIEIVASFQEAKTAKEPGRTQFAEMIEFLERGDAEGILAWHPDRLARNSIDGGRIIYALDTGKLKDLKFPAFWFDNTPQGKFMLNIAFGQSKYYVDNLSQNVKRGIRQKLRKGQWPSFAPLGYTNNLKLKTIEVDSVIAPIIRKAFELYSTGDHTLKSIQSFLTNAGLRTTKENLVGLSSIQRILTSPFYYGMLHYDGELYEAAHEPIISRKLFEAVQSVMKNKGKKKRIRKHNHAFQGFMKCGTCGCAITAELQKGHVYYRCTKKKGICPEKYVREEALMNQMKEQLQKFSYPDEWLLKMRQSLEKEQHETHQDNQSDIQRLQAEKQNVESKLDKLLDLQLNGTIDAETYVQKKNMLMNDRIKLDQEIKAVESQGNNRLEPLFEFIKDLGQAKILSVGQEREEFRSFMKKIGSNFLLKGALFELEAKNGWRELVRGGGFSGWQAQKDSNPH